MLSNVFSSNTHSFINNCVFKLLEASVGGAISIINSDYTVNLCYTTFEKCTSTDKKTSSSGRVESSGGCCYIDVCTINISNTYTTNCKSNNYAHAIYTSIPQNKYSYVSCLCDYLSGKLVSPYSTVYGFDKGDYIFNDINITFPNEITYPGAMHSGKSCAISSYHFLNIKYNINEESIGISFSLTNDGNNEVEFANFERCHSKDDKGILGLLHGCHNIKNCNFIDCVGNLAFLTTDSDNVYISNCFISSSIIINNDIVHNTMNVLVQFPITGICIFQLKQSCESCAHRCSSKTNLKLYTLIYFFISQ